MNLKVTVLSSFLLFNFAANAKDDVKILKEVCVKNVTEFNEMKSKGEIPALFHPVSEKPVFFSIDKFEVSGGLKVRAHEKGHFVFEGYFRKLFMYDANVTDIQKICFLDKEMKGLQRKEVVVHFGPKKDPYSAFVENSGISIDGYLIANNRTDKNFEKIKKKVENVLVGQQQRQSEGAF